jgi:ribosomal protein L11 methyltransferase
MSYLALRFDADADVADAWADALLDAGALAVDASDPRAGTDEETPQYGEPGATAAAWWPVSRLCALFATDADPESALQAAAAATGRPVPPHERHTVAEQDWVRATQAQFGPIAIAPDFWIVPSWCAPPAAAARVVTLDPGLAFGTGSHPTTRLCLEWLRERIVPGECVLDYGCGSGILAIGAAVLGAREVVGTDVDPQAIRAGDANALANGVSARFVLPNALGTGTFDVVVANILANPLVLLAPALAARVRPGGSIALSGILEPQAADVIAAYARWFTLGTWRSREGWVLLAGTRAGGLQA